MTQHHTSVYKRWLFSLLALAGPALLPAQVTTVSVTNTPIQSPIKRFGINLGTPNFYDSGQMTKNLVYTTNPSFEGEIYQSLIQCGSGTANSCADVNIYTGFTPGFWSNASYTMITGTSAGRSGTICGFSGNNYPANGGLYTFCDSGTAPAVGDYMLVRTTVPTDVGWPLGGDWLTIVGGGTFTAETTDLPPGTLGKQSGLLTAATGSDSVSVNMFFDSTPTKSFVQLNGSYVITFKAKGVAGNKNIVVSLTRGANTLVSQTQSLTNSWATYTIPFTGTENGSALTKVKLSFAAAGPDTIELDDVSLTKTGTDPANTTIFRDEVVQALQGTHPGVIRFWVDQLGDSLDNLLAPSTGRQRSGYTPYAGFDGTNITFVNGVPAIGTFQTQSLKVGLTEFLQLCQLVGADPWIVVPSTFDTGEAYNLIDYLAADGSTPYGAKRIAAGQTAPWTSVFNVIHLEFGNEEWNGGTFKGGALETGSLSYSPYGQRASAIFTAMKGNPGYSHAKFDLIINGQSASPFSNYFTQLSATNNDSFSIAPYMMYNISSWSTVDKLFGTTFAEAEAFVTAGASSEGVGPAVPFAGTLPYITAEQVGTGKPIVTSEMGLSPTGTPPSGGDGPLSQAAMNGYASSVGSGLAVLDSMFQQLRAGVLTQNLFALPGWEVATATNTNALLWGAVVDMGVTNLKRPVYLALELANNAIGTKTQMLQTQHTGTDPTDNQYNFGLNSVTLPTFHFLQSFAFTDGVGSYSLVVFNVSPDFSQPINFGGAIQPTGTVTVQQLTSANITDTNETSNVVQITSPAFSSTMTLPAYSMTVFSWGSGAPVAPLISGVTTNGTTANSTTVTWSTDQPATSQVFYGTTTAYGSQSALNSTLVTSHSVTITGLTAGTLYDFDVASTNSSSQSTTSPNATFTTTAVPPVISAVTTTGITNTTATITWTTDQSSTSQVNYGTTISYGSQSPLDSTLVTAHSVAITGLTPGTTYDFTVTSTNGSAGTTTSANFMFTTTGTAPPVISAVTATAITSSSATITWTTDQASSSQVNYGTTTAYGTQSALNSTLVTSHSVTITGLTPSTLYDFDVVSANSTNVSTTSPNATFTTTAVGPVISAVAATAITSTSATINWTTDQASSSLVNYGTTTAYGSQSALNSTLTTTHSVALTGLTPGTTYNFAVVSANSSSASSTSGNFTFATPTSSGPVISSVSTFPVADTTASINWVTDVNATSQVNYGLTSAYGSSSPLNSTLAIFHSVGLTGLAPGSTYHFAIVTTNGAGGTTTSPDATFTTSGTPIISAVTATAITTTSATITWTTDQPTTSLVNYGTTTAYGSQSPLNSTLTTAHSVVLTGLTPGTTYNYDVASTNSSNTSATSPNATFATPTSSGPAISAVTATGITSTSATITWTTDQASSSQVNYGTTTAYGSQSTLNSALVTSHSVTITGLTQGTLYDFDVVSTNSSSLSTTSPNATFTTTAVAPVISAVTATGITTTSATITWTTDQASSSQVNYGTTTAYGSQSTLNSALVTSHSVTITGLTQGTLYDFDVVSTNGANLSSTSPNATFTTTAVAPVISAVTATAITSTAATITWTTDQPSSSQVSYGTTTVYGSQSTFNSALVTSHSVTITGLTPGTLYDFDVFSANSSNLSATSPNATFSTTAVGPVISAVTATAITSTSATITWTTDQPSSSQVSYGTTTSYGSQSTLNNTLVTSHSVTITGLTQGTQYDFSVVSTNSSSLSTTSPNATFTTTAVAPVISAVTATAITTTSATITWTTDQASSSQVNYGTTTAYGTQSTLNSALVTSHLVTITGLTQGTLYDFDVVSTNGSSLSSTSPNATFTTTAVAPVISAVTATAITTTGATITWTTDQPSSSQVNYGTTTAYGTQSALNSALVTAHSVTITGTTPGTLYDFDVVSTNSSSLSTTSPNATFTTTAVAPVISAVASTGITTTSATITWTTDQPSNSQVNYGTTTAYGSQSALNSALVTAHSVTITGLTPGTLYDFDVVSTNSSSLSTTSPNATFTTTAVAPVISAVASTGITTTSATITWTTDQPSSSQVNYGATTAYGSQSALNSALVTSHSVTITGLTAGTLYDFDVVSTNSSSLSATSPNATLTTTAVAPVISAVTATAITTTGATITWTTDQPSSSQVNYGTTTAYGSQSALNSALVTAHSVTITGTTPGTLYDFDVVSTNSSSLSATSPNATFTTTAVAPVISAVTATAITTTGATITWTTDQPSSSQVNYGTTTAYGTQSALNSALVTAHSVTITGTTPGTLYDFDVVSTNSSSLSATSPNATFTTTAVAPVISAVTATAITTTGATITWTTDQPSSSQVNYGTTTAYGTQSALNSALVTAHSVTITGTTPGTLYDFDVVSTNSSSLSATSPNATFTTTAVAPVISAVTATAITTTGATITWTTDQPSSSQVNYGTTTAYGTQSALNSTLVTAHSVTITGLTPGTLYDFDVVSTNSSSLSTTSPNATFTTTAVAPVISAVATTGITSTSATITWTTDQPSSSQVNYGTTAAYGSQSALNSALVTAHSVTITGLTPNTLYDFDVVSTNSSSLTATSPNSTLTTAPPPAISAVTATAITTTSATITWTTDQPSSSQVNYGTTTAYGSQSLLNSALVTSHSVTLTGLTPATLYDFDVISVNGSNASTTSTNSTLTTTTPAPPVLSGVTATGISSTSATITWTTDETSSSQVAYGTTPAYGSQSPLNSALVTSHSVTITGLTSGTTYNYAVTSVNGFSGSTTSGNFTFTTTVTPPPVLTSEGAWPVGDTTASILWTSDQPTTSQVKYGTTPAYGSQSALNSSLAIYHVVPISGLMPGTTYNFSVMSTNSSGVTTNSGNFTFTTTGMAPMLFTSVTATNITSTSATITWTTSQASTTQVAYGPTTSYGILSSLDTSMVFTHSVTLTGLTPNTTYNYVALSTNAAVPAGVSANFTFPTTGTGGASAPVISFATATGITPSSATITWTTDQPATDQVEYGTTTSYGSLSTLSNTLVTSHTVTLTGLTQGTTYNYAVISANGSAMSTTSANFTFTTSTTSSPAPVITNVASWPVTGTGATILWTTDQNTTSQVNYGTTTTYGIQSALTSTLGLYHAVSLTGLTSGTTYNYQVVSTNGSGVTSTSPNFSFTTTGTAPMVFSAVTATNITSTSATITWTTSQASSTQVEYGTTTAYGSLSTLNNAFVTSHSVTLTGLNPGTIYNYVALSNNASVPAGASANFTFVTSSGGAAPVISLVTATGITSTAATITWATDQVSSSQVTYGTTTSYGTLSSLNAALVTSHSVTLTGLTPGTTYDYAAISTNSSSLSTTSGNFTFTTPTSSSPAPIITNVASWPVADTTASILWTTDQNTTSQVNYGLTTAYGSQSPLNSTLGLYHVVPLAGLIPGTTYNYQVVSTNGSGVTTTSANFTFKTTGTAPSQPATVVSSVIATAITSTSATITWTTDETSTTQVAYGTTTAYGSLSALDGSLTTAHSMMLTGLTPATNYDFAVTSTNGSGISTTSGNFMFTTASIPINPPVISAVTATNLTSSSATITWTTDQTSSSQVKYGTTTAYGSLSTLSNTLVTSHSVTLMGLTAGTTYDYAVMSTNTGSMQTTSANFTFATPSTTSSSPYVTGQTLGSLRSYSNSCNGFIFTIGSSNITITNLGRWVLAGNTGTHNVTIQTMSGTPVVSTSVSTSGQTAGQYVWGSVAPTQLLANTEYWIGSTETYPGDQWLDDNTTVTVGPAAAIVGSAYSTACPGAPTLNLGGPQTYGPVNFQYSIP